MRISHGCLRACCGGQGPAHGRGDRVRSAFFPLLLCICTEPINIVYDLSLSILQLYVQGLSGWLLHVYTGCQGSALAGDCLMVTATAGQYSSPRLF